VEVKGDSIYGQCAEGLRYSCDLVSLHRLLTQYEQGCTGMVFDTDIGIPTWTIMTFKKNKLQFLILKKEDFFPL
jgi:hypothetical protein